MIIVNESNCPLDSLRIKVEYDKSIWPWTITDITVRAIGQVHDDTGTMRRPQSVPLVYHWADLPQTQRDAVESLLRDAQKVLNNQEVSEDTDTLPTVPTV